ncbi:hypothetical protein A2680_03655 [Candidatus Kaiserbacteria bacterium RIFCSPHIGHO2_01_FULL_55_37]|nr:MAG: hypothetical protein A2680_03655 [Candidatus Kaiserbacteria bacterium RIFCSPHIGHO2_01_FULL_55_37]
MAKGVVIKIDGIDGCGKGTLVENLHTHYNSKLRVVTTREFGNDQDANVSTQARSGTVSRMLCEIALNPRLEFDPIEKSMMLTVVERRQNRLVLPNLREQYDLILSDRSSLSRAYESELGDPYQKLFEWAVEPLLEEDMVLWIDVDPKVAFSRTVHNTEFVLEHYEADANEIRGFAYQVEVSRAYKMLSSQKNNIIRIDGNVDVENLTREAIEHIDTILTSI